MKKIKAEVISKVCKDAICVMCNGTGKRPPCGPGTGNICNQCEGTGKYTEQYHIIIAGKNAIDSDMAGK